MGGRGHDAGRWPANLIHDGSDEVVGLFPQAKSGGNVKGSEPSSVTDGIYGEFDGRVPFSGYADTGSAARFFYTAKAAKSDRDDGLEDMERKASGMVSNTSGKHITRRDEGYEVAPRANNHPTVKPTDLMRYLCRLVTPPGGTVLDPFMGSGSTGRAALLEGFRFVGIEREAQYLEIARARVQSATPALWR
jgi:site-specific DNA-methyltransferase (adenine-specific)